jgi:hypothetical protein
MGPARQRDHFAALRKETAREIGADKTRSTRDDDL